MVPALTGKHLFRAPVTPRNPDSCRPSLPDNNPAIPSTLGPINRELEDPPKIKFATQPIMFYTVLSFLSDLIVGGSKTRDTTSLAGTPLDLSEHPSSFRHHQEPKTFSILNKIHRINKAFVQTNHQIPIQLALLLKLHGL